MLVGAARNALWAFNARVSLTCPVCHRPQDATPALRPVFIARSQREVMAHRTHGSIQDRTYPSALYCTGGLPPGFLCQGPSGFMPDHRDSEREKKPVPKVLDRQYLEACYNTTFLEDSFSIKWQSRGESDLPQTIDVPNELW